MGVFSKVGDWLTANGGTAATMVGALVTGNIPTAVGLGASLLVGATGETSPDKQLAVLQGNPDALVKLEELANARQAEINRHLEATLAKEAEERMAEHQVTANVIVDGQKAATGSFEKNSRPGMAWTSLLATVAYAFHALNKGLAVDTLVLGTLASGYLAWMGLRTFDKYTYAKHGVSAITKMKQELKR
jgi:hypothetical protein